MNTTTNQEIECTGLDTEGDRHSFSITILERFPRYMIVKKGKRKLIFNKAERSLRRQTTGKLLYVAVMTLSSRNRYLL